MYDYITSRDPKSLRIVQVVDTETMHPIRFFVRGDEYRFWGRWRGNLHLFGIDDPEALILLWGADDQGRDLFSRVVYGARLDFTQAAKYLGASEMRIILKHMVPSFSSHLIAVLALRVPEMILAETSLSFLGLGLREPVISWGVLLTGVQNIRAVALAPWLFLPGVAIIVTVLAFNFVGDGLRDAADPYSQ